MTYRTYTRDVFYLPGYDPRSYRFYYSKLKRNLLEQNKINGLNLSISACKKDSSLLASCHISHPSCQTHYHFFCWKHIIMQYWSKSPKALLNQIWCIIQGYLCSKDIMLFFRHTKDRLFAGFYPLLFIFFALGVNLCISAAMLLYLPFVLALKLMLAALLFGALSWFWFWLAQKSAVFWLLNIYAFCAKYPLLEPTLSTLANEFAAIIQTKLKQNQHMPNYELIICAHSVGSIVLIDLLASLIKSNPPGLHRLKILTLGGCIPLVSFQKKAILYREKLQNIAHQSLIWYDFTSKIDGACFPMLNFFAIAKIPTKHYPVFKTPKFYQLFCASTYKKIRYNWYRVHFLYLEANEILGEYDYFHFIGGPQFLEEKIMR